MSEYDALKSYLAHLPHYHKEAVFFLSGIREILGKTLPKSAHNRRQWWENEYSSGGTHPQARAWVEAGWKVDDGGINMKEKWSRFVRV